MAPARLEPAMIPSKRELAQRFSCEQRAGCASIRSLKRTKYGGFKSRAAHSMAPARLEPAMILSKRELAQRFSFMEQGKYLRN
jgi:hypothetical protein